MKQITLFWLILCPFYLVSQIDETFSGPFVTSNYPWQGDLNDFRINSYSELEFNSLPGEGGAANLYLSIDYRPSMRWEFSVMTDFKPTNSNNLRVYVFQCDAGDDNTLYYIQVGNNTGQVSFYSFSQGKSTLRIGGRKSLLQNGYIPVEVRLTLDQNKEWNLYTRTGEEQDFYHEGTYSRPLARPPARGDLALTFRYIKSRQSSFYMDYIRVWADEKEPEVPIPPPPVEEVLPVLLKTENREDTWFYFVFDGPVQIEEAVVWMNGEQTTGTLSYGEDPSIILFHWTQEVRPPGFYRLEIKGLSSPEGTALPVVYQEFDMEKEEEVPGGEENKNEEENPDPGDNEEGEGGENDGKNPPLEYGSGAIRINEIMADPKGNPAFPETEYVELYNTTDEEIDLKNWSFIYGTTVLHLPEFLFPPESYLVLFRDGRDIYVDDKGYGLGLPNFPAALANNGKYLQLKDPSGNAVDQAVYVKGKAGKSWEVDESGEWFISTDPRGGTPGAPNSSNGDPAVEPPGATGPSDKIDPLDIIINEILPEPYPEGSEFIELYNRSGSTLVITGLSVCVRKSDGSLGTRYPLAAVDKPFEMDSYYVLTKDKEGVLAWYTCPVPEHIFEIKMPVLSNTSATIVLLDADGETILDEVPYTSKWHAEGTKAKKVFHWSVLIPKVIQRMSPIGHLPHLRRVLPHPARQIRST